MRASQVRDEEGFRFSALMVGVLIIGVLGAIALPTFLGARTRAQDRAAQSTIRQAFTSSRVVFSDTGDYLTATTADFQAVDTSVQWVPGATSSTGPTTVSGGTTAGILTLAAFSKSGNCFFLRDDPPHDTRYGEIAGATWADCNAGNGGAVPTWAPTW